MISICDKAHTFNLEIWHVSLNFYIFIIVSYLFLRILFSKMILKVWVGMNRLITNSILVYKEILIKINIF